LKKYSKLKSLETVALGQLAGRIFFQQLMASKADFITRFKTGAKYKVTRTLSQTNALSDRLIVLGTGYQGNPMLNLRLVEVRCGSTWYHYLTSVVDPEVLPPYILADLYARRWRIEETFNTLLVAYLAAPENQDLGVVKAQRRKRLKPPQDLSPFPLPKVLTSATFA
jgi:hypothetical protein